MRENLDTFYLEDLVELFQTCQNKWNILKKIIKLVERTYRPNYYTYDKIKELYKYFYELSIGKSAAQAVDTAIRYVEYLKSTKIS